MTGFQLELEALINKWSKEAGSDTPDFMLAKYLCACLDAFDLCVQDREKWHGRKPVQIGGEMTKINDGGPAFPIKITPIGEVYTNVYSGLTKREWFAGQALKGFLSAMAQEGLISPEDLDKDWIAGVCFKYADAMIKESQKRRNR